MNRRMRGLVVTALVGAVAFAIAVTLVNVRSTTVARREARSEVITLNRALCDLLRFSATPGPTPPQPRVEPTSDFGKQLAEYNRLQAIRQVEGRAKLAAAIKRYC